MMGLSDLEANCALITSMIERRADGVYFARLGDTVLRSFFQPIIEVGGDGYGVCGYEALIRPYRNGCAISAEMFFANVAPEEAGFIDPLCRALHFANFAAFGPKDCSLLVNIEPAAFGDAGFAEMAAVFSLRRLTDCGLNPDQVIFEIVERVSTDERAIFAIAERLRVAGVRIAVDDFGGQALDFARLAMLRPDLVKMDGGVLQQARSGGPHLKQLSRLCQLVDRFGIDLLIEGVETADDLQTCRGFHPRYLQGHRFGRPVKRPLAPEVYNRRLIRAGIKPAGCLDEKTATAVAWKLSRFFPVAFNASRRFDCPGTGWKRCGRKTAMRRVQRHRITLAMLLALEVWVFSSHHAVAQTSPSATDAAAYSGLHKAAQDGDVAAITQLLAGGADTEARDGNRRTPLHVAAFASHEDAVAVLAAGGADVNALDADLYDMVTIAAVANDVAMLKAALAAGNEPGLTTSRYDGTALIAAAHLGHAEVVRVLIDAGAPLDHINNLGWTALIEAVILGDGGPHHQATVRHLVEAGADQTIADRQGQTPLDHARARGYDGIVAILQER